MKIDKHMMELGINTLVGGLIVMVLLLIMAFYPGIMVFAVVLGLFLILSAIIGAAIVPFVRDLVQRYWGMHDGSAGNNGATWQRYFQRDVHEGGRDRKDDAGDAAQGSNTRRKARGSSEPGKGPFRE